MPAAYSPDEDLILLRREGTGEARGTWRGRALVATVVLAVTLSGTVIALLLSLDPRVARND